MWQSHREADSLPVGQAVTPLFMESERSRRMLSHLNPVRILPCYIISILILSLLVRSYLIHFRNHRLYSTLIHMMERHSTSCSVRCSMKLLQVGPATWHPTTANGICHSWREEHALKSRCWVRANGQYVACCAGCLVAVI